VPDLPKEAVDRAAEAITRELMSGTRYEIALDSDEALARAALEAAAPVLAGHVAKRILAHMNRRNARRRRGVRAYRRHFITAAQVASRAFSTDDDLRRAAVEVLNRAYRERTEADGR